MKFLFPGLVLLLIFTNCKTLQPTFSEGEEIPVVDYSNLKNWAAHPEKEDPADRIPGQNQLSDQSDLKADVFFIHPTIYSKLRGAKYWTPSLEDDELNSSVDESTILYQASAFNQAGRVFAPRYRQAHIHAYSVKDDGNAKEAFRIAYEDVKNAFEYYLKHYNNGRPIIIAGHSQGTTHGGPLVKEFFDGKPLQKQFVAAYLLGMPVPKNYFSQITPCEDKNETGCFISWRTFKKGHMPSRIPTGDSILVTNPLSWKTDEVFIPKSENIGGVVLNFEEVLPNLADAQVKNGILWTSKPKFPWSFLYTRKNYHIADVNFYYMNIQQNAVNRVKAFLTKPNN